MKTLEEKKKELYLYLFELVKNEGLYQTEAQKIKYDVDELLAQCRKESFEAGQQAANKVHEQTQEFLNKKI